MAANDLITKATGHNDMSLSKDSVSRIIGWTGVEHTTEIDCCVYSLYFSRLGGLHGKASNSQRREK